MDFNGRGIRRTPPGSLASERRSSAASPAGLLLGLQWRHFTGLVATPNPRTGRPVELKGSPWVEATLLRRHQAGRTRPRQSGSPESAEPGPDRAPFQFLSYGELWRQLPPPPSDFMPARLLWREESPRSHHWRKSCGLLRRIAALSRGRITQADARARARTPTASLLASRRGEGGSSPKSGSRLTRAAGGRAGRGF